MQDTETSAKTALSNTAADVKPSSASVPIDSTETAVPAGGTGASASIDEATAQRAGKGAAVAALRKKNLTIGSLCFLAYTACYIGKNILSSLMPSILEALPESAGMLGTMTSVFLLTYGIGQLINGMIGNVLPAKWMVFIGLGASGGILFFLPTAGIGTLGCVLFGISGFFSSMLYGPISALIGENTEDRAAKAILTALTVASILGSLVTYLLAFLAALSSAWRPFFSLAGALMLVIALVWLLVCTHMERTGMIARRERRAGTSQGGHLRSGILSFAFVSMVMVTMLNGIIRNATSLWVPTFLNIYLGFSTADTSLISSVLPVVSIVGTFLSLWILRFFRYDEKTECLALFFLAALGFATVLLVGTAARLLTLVALFLAMAAMYGACNMIFSVYVLRFRDFGIISGMSGFLDFASYMSASAASFLFSAHFEARNLSGIVLVWAISCAAGVVFSFTAKVSEKKN